MKTNGTLKVETRSLLHYGRENARTGKEIAKVLGFNNDRLVRHAIRELIAEGVPIASSVTPPPGYFIANSLDEAIEYMRNLKSRLVEDAYRRRDFKVAAREILQPCQMPLFKVPLADEVK